MLAQKIISKLLNITKSSRFFFGLIVALVGFSAGFCQYVDFFKSSKSSFLDSSLHASPPWPD